MITELASQEAQRLGHEQAGTEHLLLAIITLGNGVAVNALQNARVDFSAVRMALRGS